VRELSAEEIAAATTENVFRLFKKLPREALKAAVSAQ
jgi:hypothetical protein